MKIFIYSAMKENLHVIIVISDGVLQIFLTIQDAKVKAIQLLSTFRNVLQLK